VPQTETKTSGIEEAECAADNDLPVMNSPVGGKRLDVCDNVSAMLGDKSTNEINEI